LPSLAEVWPKNHLGLPEPDTKTKKRRKIRMVKKNENSKWFFKIDVFRVQLIKKM
jgi:hypothetical protein